MKTHLDLFSGIGGFALAAQWNGFTTVGFCEIEPYAQKVIIEKFDAVPADSMPAPQWRQSWQGKARLHADIFTLRGTDYAGVDLITGGFPCQPFSCAGKRRGKEDDRHLWPEMRRVIDEARPAWVLAENVPGIIGMELDAVLSDLENIGYACWPVVMPACAVDARHRRDRVWIVAYANELRARTGLQPTGNHEAGLRCEAGTQQAPLAHAAGWGSKRGWSAPGQAQGSSGLSSGSSQDVADAAQGRLRRRQSPRQPGQPAFGGEALAYAMQHRSTSGRADSAGRKEGNPTEFINGGSPVPNGDGGGCTQQQELNCGPTQDSANGDSRRGHADGCSGPARWEPEPELGGGTDGLSGWLDKIEGLNDEAKTRAREILYALRDEDVAEAIQWNTGRFSGVSEAEVLLALLCELDEGANGRSPSLASGTTARTIVRGLWQHIESARSPHRRKYSQQHAQQYSDALRELSRQAPSLYPQAWADDCWENGMPRVTVKIPNRAARLKGLGNSIVPQVAAQIISWMNEASQTPSAR